MILAESLLLIALDDDKGKDETFYGSDPALAAALLLDLAKDGHVHTVDDRLEPSASPPAHPALRAAHEVIAQDEKRRKPKDWVGRLPGKLRPFKERVADPLVEAGVLEEDRRKRLGLFETVRYPTADPEPERALRAGLREVLVDGREPTVDEALLLSLLEPLDLVKAVVEKPERKAAKARAKEVMSKTPESKAVKDTIEGVQAAMIATVAVSAATTASTSS